MLNTTAISRIVSVTCNIQVKEYILIPLYIVICCKFSRRQILIIHERGYTVVRNITFILRTKKTRWIRWRGEKNMSKLTTSIQQQRNVEWVDFYTNSIPALNWTAWIPKKLATMPSRSSQRAQTRIPSPVIIQPLYKLQCT